MQVREYSCVDAWQAQTHLEQIVENMLVEDDQAVPRENVENAGRHDLNSDLNILARVAVQEYYGYDTCRG